MQTGHDSEWASHYASVKTLQRIQAHFFWPEMRSQIDRYCRSCSLCQKHSRKTKLDRIPISPMLRSDVAFDKVNVDLIGPLDPPSSRGHKYILCLVDNCTKWVECFPLRTLKSVEAIDALLSIFTRIGIPRVVTTDNATNFVSGLNDELYRRLGIEIRHSLPGHPEWNSSVERWNKTLKYMLHHVTNSDKPRDWDKRLPYLLWAYRELPHSTLGLSPYQLVYGRHGRGPLSILRDSRSDNLDDPPLLNKTASEYLTELQRTLSSWS